MTDENFALRDVTSADAPAIAGLLAELGHPTNSAEIPGLLTALLEEGGRAMLAIDNSGEPLGMITFTRHATLHRNGPVAYITALVTAPTARHRGVGRALVSAAKQWARSHGCAQISVTSAEHRADAHAFYPSCGMPYTGRRFAASLDTSD